MAVTRAGPQATPIPMQRQTLTLAVIAILLVGAAAFVMTRSGDDPGAPLVTWSEAEEVDGSQPEDAQPAESETAELERTQADPLAAEASNELEDTAIGELRERLWRTDDTPTGR